MVYASRPTTQASPTGMDAYAAHYIEHLTIKNYAPNFVAGRRMHLRQFFAWLNERGITRLNEVTRPILERYSKHLHYALNRSGRPLSIGSQSNRLTTLRSFFRYLVRQNHLLYNAASELELPRAEHRLPQAVMSAAEAERVLMQPDLSTADGVLHRAVMEVLYSTGIRRAELVNLDVADLNTGRGVLSVRQGKGRKDRFVPIGDRALLWVQNIATTCAARGSCRRVRSACSSIPSAPRSIRTVSVARYRSTSSRPTSAKSAAATSSATRWQP